MRATAPKVERIVDALGSPGFLTLPSQIGELMQRLGPLTQLAESAGGLFGGLRLPGATRPAPATSPVIAPSAPAASPSPSTPRGSEHHPAARAAKKAASKQPTAKKAPAKKRAKKSSSKWTAS